MKLLGLEKGGSSLLKKKGEKQVGLLRAYASSWALQALLLASGEGPRRVQKLRSSCWKQRLEN